MAPNKLKVSRLVSAILQLNILCICANLIDTDEHTRSLLISRFAQHYLWTETLAANGDGEWTNRTWTFIVESDSPCQNNQRNSWNKKCQNYTFRTENTCCLTHPINETINLTRSTRDAKLSLLYPYTHCLPSLSPKASFLCAHTSVSRYGNADLTKKNNDDGQTYRKAGAMDALYTLDAAVLRF